MVVHAVMAQDSSSICHNEPSTWLGPWMSLAFARFYIRNRACTVASRCPLKEKIVAVAIDQYAAHSAKHEQLEQLIPATEQTPAGIN